MKANLKILMEINGFTYEARIHDYGEGIMLEDVIEAVRGVAKSANVDIIELEEPASPSIVASQPFPKK